MKVKVDKTITIELDSEESGMFSGMLKLAITRLEDWQRNSQDIQFRQVGEEVQSFDRMKGFIEDLMRGIR